MNLFSFGNDPNNAGFAVSAKVWVFFLLTIPLTALTVGIWFVISRRRGKVREEQKRRELEREGEGEGGWERERDVP